MTLDLYSGVVLNQNAVASGQLPATNLYQTFQLPADYARGSTAPPLTGFQLCTEIATAATATLDWTLDQLINAQWTTLVSGRATGTAHTGQTWFNVFFTAPLQLDATWATDTFRITVSGTDGLDDVFYATPNPISSGQAFHSDDTPLTENGGPASLLFRVLGLVADSGTDFLGNLYRSLAVKVDVNDVAAIGALNSYWLSQPSPSQFAVEAFYLDMRSGNDPVVLDRMTIDPITPGVYAHVYYSNDPGGPGVDSESWDNLLWTPAYLPVQMVRQQTFAFPQPLTAKYIKVEFTNLQPKPYDPGQFQLPCTFRKFPAWVLDFFLGQFSSVVPDLLASGIDITYDAIDLAYSYYSRDILQEPAAPALATGTAAQQNPPLFQQPDAGTVDPTTLAQVKLAFRPFTAPPGLQGDIRTALGALTASTTTSNYSTETVLTALGNTSVVSNLQREALLVEKAFPPMFFFLPCRHTYRVSQAMFEHNIGYFAGVRQLTFHRDVYTTAFDHSQYNEVLGDGINTSINDWSVPELDNEDPPLPIGPPVIS